MANNKIVVSSILDYVVEITGEYDYKQNETFTIKNKPEIKLFLISATSDKAYCLTNAQDGQINVDDVVEVRQESLEVKTSKDMFGKITDIWGKAIFSKEKNLKLESQFYDSVSKPFNKPNLLLDYEPINEQLITGYVSVDLLIPVGRGQRQLIIGDRKTGKSFIALNTIINQKNQNVKCIYVAIGQTQGNVANVYETLKQNDALDYTIIINSSANNPFDQYLAPYIAMAHAENISKTEDVLIVFDDLTTHANIFREIALLTNKPVGKEAFPGDMFFAHSRLLERSGKFKGRKSITALPIVQTVDNDITSLIASNIISITDGQLVTSSDIFASGKLPAINIDLSVSRIGGSAQTKHIAKVSSEIGKIYKAYRRQIKLASLKYDLNDQMSTLIQNGTLIDDMFNQRGVSVYNQKSIYLISKLIAWNILKGVKNIPEAMKFIDILINNDEIAKKSFESLINNTATDSNIIRNYFAFMLNQYSEFNNLDWRINVEKEFVKPEQSIMQKYTKLTKGEK
ncbi:MSC_0619 family F1-like ATPase alpha subunit [[Mycoplasma] gypis]|uniref:ATP F0F1 synthase subunit alpha n=1 Tax=[Mycoplasma] gypis TaxID=92404 RepID=A0ABZ2RML1_9BACT|nr:ATP F0F1 synthase subunit alpha [[Mycoplasma] gypis]MBN0919021.1 ATP F0F1 synthase subunit alpha [[Mycoplasma] gypis]